MKHLLLLILSVVATFGQAGVSYNTTSRNVLQTNLNARFATITNTAATAAEVAIYDAGKKLVSTNAAGARGLLGVPASSLTLTLAGTANEITSSAGAQDLSANRAWTFSLPTALTFTGKTVTGGTFSSPTLTTPTIASLVNATHTHANAAGGGTLDAAVIASGTLALARGGTGASLADPGADRILFWDESGNVVNFLTVGSGLDLTGTTLTATGGGGGAPVGTMVNVGASTAGAIPTYDDITGTNLIPSLVLIDVLNNFSTPGTVSIDDLLIVSSAASPSQITGNVNDYKPLTNKTVVRLDSDSAVDITGLDGSFDGGVYVQGVIRILQNVGSFNITLRDESGSSVAENRFALRGDVVLEPGQSYSVLYDIISERWRPLVDFNAIKQNNVLAFSTTSSTNSGSSETDLVSYTMPGGTMASNGDSVEMWAVLQFPATLNAKRVRVKFGATTIFDSGALGITAATDVGITARIIRASATTQKTIVEANTSSAVLTAYAQYTAPAETLSGSVVFKITGQGTADADIIFQSWKTTLNP